MEYKNQLGGQLTTEQIQSLKTAFDDPTSNHQQIQYCLAQMRRFAICMKNDETTPRKYQFFYQIGRIQELLKSNQYIWWQPFEQKFKAKDFNGIIIYIELLRLAIGCEYDPTVGTDC